MISNYYFTPMLPSFVCEVTLGYMLAYRNCKCAEQLKFKITICGSYNMGKPDIIYEDNDIIVCYKPAGIATQTRRIGQQDMESFIRNYRAAKNEPPYVGIVHRLDQPVEGVMVFAKNQKAAASLSRQIKEHTTEKYYRAASRGQGVSGTDKKEDNHAPAWHTLTDYISFDKRTNTSKITSEIDRLAKKAVELPVVHCGQAFLKGVRLLLQPFSEPVADFVNPGTPFTIYPSSASLLTSFFIPNSGTLR